MKTWTKKWILILPFLFLSLMTLSSFSNYKAQNKEKLKIQSKGEEIQQLLDLGFEKEAMKEFNFMGEKNKKELSSLYFQTLIENRFMDQAERLLEEDPSLVKKPENLLKLAKAYEEKNLYSKALNLYIKYQKSLDPELYQKRMISLLQKKRSYPIKEKFIDGWFQDLAILKNDEGYYFLAPNGQRVDHEIYDFIEPLDQGFYCARNGQTFLLDENRKLIKILDKEIKTYPKKKKDPEEIIKVYKKGNLYGYKFNDQPLTKASYNNASAVSSKGTAFVSLGKETYIIRFLAMEN